MMDHPWDYYERKRRCELAKDGQTIDNQWTNEHANQASYLCDNHRTLASQTHSQIHVAASQPQVDSSDDRHNMDARGGDLQNGQRTPLMEHRELDDNGKPSSIQLPKYRDDRDASIIHFGVVGTHEGKTFIPKLSVHRNALDDLAHPHNEDQDFYVLGVNLDGDQIDRLLHYSEIYNARGEHTNFL
jgi:hypothetical protein